MAKRAMVDPRPHDRAMAKKPKTSEEDWRMHLALALVETGMRNSWLE
jgi:hypothetical protein